MTVSRRDFLAASAIAVVRIPSRKLDLPEVIAEKISRAPPPTAGRNNAAFIGPPIMTDEWTSGWTTAKPFSVGGKRYLFLLKAGNGKVHVHEFNANGTLGCVKHSYDWTAGWTTVAFYEVGGATYLALLKKADSSEDGHRAHFHAMNLDGSVGSRVYSTDWSAGWSHLVPFTTNAGTYLLLYRDGDAEAGKHARIYRAQSNGSLTNAAVHEYGWHSGWTSITPYVIGGNTYLLFVRSGAALSGGIRQRVLPAAADGSIGSSIQNSPWGADYTRVSVITAAQRTHVLLYNDDGRVHLHAIRPDGAVGSRMAWYATAKHKGMENGSLAWREGPIPWSQGWTSIESYSALDGNTYLFLLKSGETATVHIHPINPMEDVGPAVTHVDSSRATIWLGLVGGSLETRAPLTLEYRGGTGPQNWHTVTPQLLFPSGPPGSTAGPPQDYYAAGVASVNVTPSGRYEYRFKAGNNIVGSGAFSSAPASGSRTNFRMVLASCMDVNKSRGQPAWLHVLAAAPDFVLLNGDTAYPNTTDRAMQWAEHIQQRSVASFADLISKVPTFAQWDDHDFGPNNSTGHTEGDESRKESRDTFRELFPNPLRSNAGGGNYFALRWGLVDFFVLDTRYYADKHGTTSAAILGNEQWAWLENQLNTSSARFKILTSGITLREHKATEAWLTGYPIEYQRLLRLISQTPGIILMSGDVHYCAVRTHTNATLPPFITPSLSYGFPEIIASGVGKYDEVRASCDDAARDDGYAVVDFDLTENNEKATVKLFRHDGTERTSDMLVILRSSLE